MYDKLYLLRLLNKYNFKYGIIIIILIIMKN